MMFHDKTRWSRLLGPFVLTGTIAFVGCSLEDGASVQQTVRAASSALSGAIFTTTSDGAVVNENVWYTDKREVYLDGGPGPNAPQHAAGLPDGSYYFQVTDPSGKTLLSTDSVRCREVRVAGGVIVEYVSAGQSLGLKKVSGKWAYVGCQGAEVNDAFGRYASHNTGVDVDHGAVTVQLFPYDDTPNPGGVYKVWITPVSEYVGLFADACVGLSGPCNVAGQGWQPGNAHGFVPAKSKTDNFKVRYKGKPFVAPEISVRKFHDRNLDGVQGAGEEDLVGWRVDFRDPALNENTIYTPEVLVVGQAGDYVLTESTPEGTAQTVAWVDGVVASLFPSADPTVSVPVTFDSGETHEVVFGNVGLGVITACKSYDQDGDGTIAGELEVPLAGWRFRLDPGGHVQETSANGCTVFAGLLPGVYSVTELFPTGDAWASSDGVTHTLHVVESFVDGGQLMGTEAHTRFANLCVEDGIGFGTKGYWHNKNGLTELDQADLDYANGLAPYAAPSGYFDACDEPFDGQCSFGPIPAASGAIGAVAPAGSAKAEVSAFLVDANAGGTHVEQLAQQLLAFVFNARNRLGSLDDVILLAGGQRASARELILEAVAAWGSGNAIRVQDIASVLTALNESGCDKVYDEQGLETGETSTACVSVLPATPCEILY